MQLANAFASSQLIRQPLNQPEPLMESIDTAVLRALSEWRSAGSSAILATVVRTWGSSPRPIGSMMALREDGRIVGSVSGGCIEDDLIHRYTGAFDQSSIEDRLPIESVCYGINADEAHRFGLPCGGTLELLLEINPDAASLNELLQCLEAGHLVQRQVSCKTGQVTLKETATPDELFFDGTRLVNTLGPGYRMLLIGAGALAEYLSTMAIFNGFAVTVCDPRMNYLSVNPIPGVQMVADMPDDAVMQFKANSRSCIIALTHDPKLDDLALLEALTTPAFYVGAIGSRRNSAERNKRMIEHFDQTELSLQRLRGPIGIYIGSKTPSEIAVSVMAEILAVKNGVVLSPASQVGTAKESLSCQHSSAGAEVCGVI